MSIDYAAIAFFGIVIEDPLVIDNLSDEDMLALENGIDGVELVEIGDSYDQPAYAISRLESDVWDDADDKVVPIAGIGNEADAAAELKAVAERFGISGEPKWYVTLRIS